MPDAESIKSMYKNQHDTLTRVYYADKANFPGGKAAFDVQHAAIWSNMERDLMAISAIQPPVPPGPSLEDRIITLENKVAALEVKPRTIL